jgi:hypothetical protein
MSNTIDFNARKYKHEPPEVESLLVKGPDGKVRGLTRIAALLDPVDVELIIGIIEKKGYHDKSKTPNTVRIAFLAGSDDIFEAGTAGP